MEKNETLIEAIVRVTDAYLTRVQPTAHLTAHQSPVTAVNVVENLLCVWQGEPGLEIPGELSEVVEDLITKHTDLEPDSDAWGETIGDLLELMNENAN